MKKICQKLSRILKSLGLGFGLESFANFWRVSVSENMFSEKSLSFGCGKFGLGKKVLVSVLENLVSEKSVGIGFCQIFGIVIQ